MPRIPVFKLGQTSQEMEAPQLARYTPSLSLEGLQLGIDNLRHDVHLGPRFVEQARLHIARLIARFGNVDGLLGVDTPDIAQPNFFTGTQRAQKARLRTGPSELKPLLAEIHVAALNRAKAAENLAVDMLARVALIKFLRIELNGQFAQVLERCRMMLKNYEGVRQEQSIASGLLHSKWQKKLSCARPARNYFAPCGRWTKKPWRKCGALCLEIVVKRNTSCC